MTQKGRPKKTPEELKPTEEQLDTRKKRYQSRSESAARYAREGSTAARDIGDIPEVVNKKRRDSTKKSLMKFLMTYFPHQFPLEFSETHLALISKLEDTLLHGKMHAFAVPRGSGKTTCATGAALWALLHGHQRYLVLIGATEPASIFLLESFKISIETNDLLYEDFPEVCYPVRKLERITRRSTGQLSNGQPTRIEWSSNKVVFPEIPKAKTSGAVITCGGITSGGIRGQRHIRPNGDIMRPTAFLCDDILTRESAGSPESNKKILKTINGDIRYLSGPSVPIAGLMAGTIIRPGDAVQKLLDRKLYPQWQGEAVSMIQTWPENMKLWDEWGKIYREELETESKDNKALKFYLANRQEMDKGHKVYWEQRKEDSDPSALYYSMRLYYEDSDMFYAEMQNQPQTEAGLSPEITREILRGKLNGLDPKIVPTGMDKLVAHIDIQQNILFFTIVAAKSDYTGALISYGTTPNQKDTDFVASECPVPFSRAYPKIPEEQRLHKALSDTLEALYTARFFDEEDRELKISKVGVDANWISSTDIVHECCKIYKGWAYPMKGVGYGATRAPFMERTKKKGDLLEDNWHIPKDTRGQPCRTVYYDTNFYKTRLFARLNADIDVEGSWTIYGNERINHNLLFQHLMSEYGDDIQSANTGRTVRQYSLYPGTTENHWLDNMTACCVLLSMCKCSLPDQRRVRGVEHTGVRTIKLSRLAEKNEAPEVKPVETPKNETEKPRNAELVQKKPIRLSDLQKRR